MPMDDDIKIFHSKSQDDLGPEPPQQEEASQDQFACALNLGNRLVQLAEHNKFDYDPTYFDGEDISMQAKLLLAFTICSTLGDCVSAQLSNTALNSFYNTLKMVDPAFYEELCASGAFSFYYLAIRRSREVERRVGQTFAMLCAQDGNGIYQELGEVLYCKYHNMVKKEIASFGLLKEE